MKKIIFSFMLLILFSISCVQGISLEGVRNKTATHQFNLTLINNQTAYINLLNPDARINYSYTRNATLPNSIVTINLTSLIDFAENTSINSVFQITNNLNTQKINYTLPINVWINTSLQDASYYNISILEGDYIINSTIDNLPLEEDLQFKVLGKYNETLNVTCNHTWLSCNPTFKFQTNNQVIVSIHVAVPEETSIGEYTIPISFISTNQTINKNIKVYINQMQVVFTPYNLTNCIVEINNTAYYKPTCVIEMQEYYVKIAKELTLKLNDAYNKNITITKTEYLVVGNVSKTIMDEYEMCKVTRDANVNDYLACNTNLKTCSNSLDSLQSKFVANESECWQNIISYKDNYKTTLDKEKEQYINNELEKVKAFRNRWLFIIFTPLIVFILFIVYMYYKKANYEIMG